MATKAGRYDEVLFSTHGTSGTIKAMNADTVQVEVFESDGTTNATLYDDRDKTAYSGTGSIVTPDSAGNIEFFADPGIYVLKISDDGTVLRTDTVNVSVDGTEAGDFTSLSSNETITGAWNFTGGITKDGTDLVKVPASTDDVYYVSGAGSDSADGLTPGSAFATVAKALSTLGSSKGSVVLSGSTHALPSAGITLTGGQSIVSDGPDLAVLSYAGTGTAVTMRGRMPMMRGVKVSCTDSGTSVIGIHVDAPTTDTLYPKLVDVTISASAKVSGQVGLKLSNATDVANYWGRFSGIVVENFGTSYFIDSDDSGSDGGSNSHKFSDCQGRNADTILRGDGSSANQFYGFGADTFASGVGIDLNGATRWQVFGDFEGGTGSTSYNLDSSTQENRLVIDDNCPTASTDDGTWNRIDALSAGKSKSWHADPQGRGFPYTVDNPMRGGAVGVGTANRALFIRARGGGTISKVRLGIGTSSGNICVAICKGPLGRNGPTERVATTGSIACPSSGEAEVTLDAAVTLTSQHWFVISADNTTATFDVKSTASTVSAKNYVLGLSAYQDSAFPVPASPSTSPATVPEFIMVGVA